MSMKKMYTLMAMLLAVFTMQAQVELLKDIRSGSSSGSPQKFFSYDGKVYFQANDGNGNELWVSDGTSEGTQMIDFDATSNASVSNFVVFNNSLYFDVAGSYPNYSIYKLNDTGDDATEVFATNRGSLKEAVELNGILYYIHDHYVLTGTDQNGNNTYDITYNSLYQFDGINDPALVDIIDQAQMPVGLEKLFVYNNRLLVYGKSESELATVGGELYEYDVTNKTYSVLHEFIPGTFENMQAGTTDPHSSYVRDFAILNDDLYFSAKTTRDASVDASENKDAMLHILDGTTNEIRNVETTSELDIQRIHYVEQVYAWNNKVFFQGKEHVSSAYIDGLYPYWSHTYAKTELYAYDPVSSSVTKVSNTNGSDHTPKYFCEFKDELYYIGKIEGSNNFYLHKTDGITVTTVSTEAKFYSGNYLAVANEILVGRAQDVNTSVGYELYAYDPNKATAIGDTPTGNTLTIYPNPTQGLLNIKGIESNTASYKLYSLAGAVAQQGMINNEQITLNVAKGVYMLEITVDATSEVQKVVVK